MRAIILSAGLGERLRPLTSKRAKPAIELLNMPMLVFPFYWLNTLGLSELTLNTHHLPETVRAAAMHTAPPEVQLHFSHEPAILGSGGGIWNARFHLQGDGHFAVANGDGVILAEDADLLRRMLESHKREDALATFLVCPLPGVGDKIPGVWMEANGWIRGFGNSAPTSGLECFHYASYMILSERIWNLLPEGNSNVIYDVIEPALKNGEKALAYRVDSLRWFETGNAADFLSATRECLRSLARGDAVGRCLMTILERYCPDCSLTVDSREGSMGLVHETAQVAGSARFEGFYVLGENCVVEEHARVRDSVLLPGTRVLAGTRIEGRIVI
jgi:mannose-1-phosphate guanylyltransferase